MKKDIILEGTPLKVVNIGLQRFSDAIAVQDVPVTQINWKPPVKQSAEVQAFLNKYLLDADRKAVIDEANQKAVDFIIHSDPYWVGIGLAGDVIEGLEDKMITHSGPPIAYENMVELHQKGMRHACMIEGWAKTEEEADAMLRSGEVRVVSALDYNTVGAGTGMISKSTPVWIVEDRASGKRTGTFPAEGEFQGGFYGWGNYSEEIVANQKYLKEDVFPYLDAMLKKRGGVSLKPILAQGMQMGDENHSRQDAADMIILKQCVMDIIDMDFPPQVLKNVMHYFSQTLRMFHCLGQGASRGAMLNNVGMEHSTVVTAVCGNGVEFGIKIAALGDQWFTAPSPYLEGRYTSSKYTKDDALPWCGDSCVVECAGLGGMAAAASPIVSLMRGQKMKESVGQTREMEKICVAKNHNFPIPNMDFDFLPVGIDMRLVLKTGISPILHGGNFNKKGGLIGAGTTRVPMECFEKAMRAYEEKYGK